MRLVQHEPSGARCGRTSWDVVTVMMWAFLLRNMDNNQWLGGGLKHFYFYPYLGKWSNLTHFSNGLKPPTRWCSGWYIWIDSRTFEDWLPSILLPGLLWWADELNEHLLGGLSTSCCKRPCRNTSKQQTGWVSKFSCWEQLEKIMCFFSVPCSTHMSYTLTLTKCWRDWLVRLMMLH